MIASIRFSKKALSMALILLLFVAAGCQPLLRNPGLAGIDSQGCYQDCKDAHECDEIEDYMARIKCKIECFNRCYPPPRDVLKKEE
jgi:hypothetical protein